MGNRLAQRWFVSLAVLLTIALVTGTAFAQRFDGTLRGEVTDQTAAVVPGAKVTVTNEATGVTQSTLTTSAGIYTFPNLLVGRYTVKVEAQGFAAQTRKGVAVSSNTVNEAHMKLSVGGTETTVEVQAGSEVVETTSSQVTNSFGELQVLNLPAATTNILNLATLAPNTTTQGGGVLGSGGSVGGARPRMNNFTVDGVDDNDQSVTGPISTVVQDAVAEFSLITNQFSAEYGHSGAGQFNIITKSGSNDWHGTFAHTLRNRNLNAMDNYQSNAAKDAAENGEKYEKDRYDYNLASASVGGPVIKNRFFIFGAFQYHTEGEGALGTEVDAPTSAGLSLLNNMAANSAVKNILGQFPVAPGNNACDPSLPETSTSADRCPYVNGVAIPTGTMNFQSPDFYNEYDFHINGDLNLANHRLSGRWLYNRYRSPNLPAPALPQFGGDLTFDVRKATVTDAWTITDRWINDFRLGFTRSVQGYTVPDEFLNFPNVTVTELANFVIGPESNSPQGGTQNTYQILNQQTYAAGKHTLKYGIEGRKWIAISDFLPRSRGDWYYRDLSQLVNDYAPSDFAKRGAGSGAFPSNQQAVYWFFQDDWRVNNRVTLNLGLRYEWNSIPSGSKLQTLNSISNLPGTPFMFGVPKSDRNNFAPRFGFAIDPFGDQKWSIRGGAGLAYDVNFTNLALLQLPPQLQSEQDPDITCSLPGAPAWCATYSSNVYAAGGDTGRGFLANGGLLQVNVPPTTVADARASTGGIIVDNIAPKIITWTLGVQRELFRNTSIEVRYLGTKATQLPVQVQLNARSAFANGAAPLPLWTSQSQVPTSFPLTQYTAAQFAAFGARPYPEFVGSVTAFPASGMSKYHSGAVDFVHRLTGGLYLRANYTFAKTMDNATNELFSSLVNPRRPQDGNNLQEEWGRSVLDIRHKLAVSWSYELPKLQTENGFLKTVFHGWQVNGAYVAQSGQPVTALSFSDANGNKDSAGDRAIFNEGGDPTRGSATNSVFMNPTTGAVCFTGCSTLNGDGSRTAWPTVGYYVADATAGYWQARPGLRTNIGRNTLNSPGLNNWDISLFKNTKITESKSLQFRFEMFNAFNHRQFSYANAGIFGTSDAATESSAYADVSSSRFLDPKQLNGGARAIQIGVKFLW